MNWPATLEGAAGHASEEFDVVLMKTHEF